MTDHPRPRVVLLCGGLPADTSHLEAAARDVELTVFGSRLPPGVVTDAVSPATFAVQEFTPVVRSARGHLLYVYGGLSRALDRERPDVVHVISEPWGLLSVQAARWVRANRPAKLVLHGCDTIWHHGAIAEQLARRTLLRYTLPAVDAWVAESDKALSLAGENGLPDRSLRARIHTNPRDGKLFRPPASSERARARAALGLPDGMAAIGLLGRLVPEKGVQLFIEAARLLQHHGFPARFFIAGNGPLREEVQRCASPEIVPLGPLPYPNGVLDLFTALDVLACPSLTTSWWEDQGPRSVLEAMMCGCIPMGTRTGAIPEMLDGFGALADRTTPAAVADAIAAAAALSTEPAERARLSAWAHSRYSGDAAAGQLVELWRDLVSGSSDRADTRKSMS